MLKTFSIVFASLWALSTAGILFSGGQYSGVGVILGIPFAAAVLGLLAIGIRQWLVVDKPFAAKK